MGGNLGPVRLGRIRRERQDRQRRQGDDPEPHPLTSPKVHGGTIITVMRNAKRLGCDQSASGAGGPGEAPTLAARHSAAADLPRDLRFDRRAASSAEARVSMR